MMHCSFLSLLITLSITFTSDYGPRTPRLIEGVRPTQEDEEMFTRSVRTDFKIQKEDGGGKKKPGYATKHLTSIRWG